MRRQPHPPSSQPRSGTRRLTGVVVALAAIASGCSSEPPSTHGDVLGDSLNGVSAFVQVLRDRGHTVAARPAVSKSLFWDYDVAILFVDGTGPVDETTAARLEVFLARSGPQSLLFVGRDGDWGADYWRFVADRDDLEEAKRRRARGHRSEADRRLEAWYDGLPTATAIVPFTETSLVVRGEASENDALRVIVRAPEDDGSEQAFDGRWPWRRAVMPADGDRVEWEIDGEAFLVRSTCASEEDTILVIGSDMPLLNAGLVDRGNRRIAEAVVDLLPKGSRVVLFGSAQSGDDGEDESEDAGGLWKLVSLPPNPWIAAHILLGLVLFCWSRAPIFGRSRVRATGAVRDFGHHVDALGRLLARSDDTATSAALLEEWERVGRPGLAAAGDRPQDDTRTSNLKRGDGDESV